MFKKLKNVVGGFVDVIEIKGKLKAEKLTKSSEKIISKSIDVINDISKIEHAKIKTDKLIAEYIDKSKEYESKFISEESKIKEAKSLELNVPDSRYALALKYKKISDAYGKKSSGTNIFFG